MPLLNPGTRLGSYEILSLLGAGGMGEVYRVRDVRLQREVALKVLSDVAAIDADRRERFMREALAVATLNHPNIVTIHSVEEAGTTVFLTMELVEGRSLAAALRPGGLSLERVLTIGIAVADAISAAHQKGITHRDIKPANIMLGEGEQAGRIKVLDFGLAKIVEAQVGASRASLLATEAPAPTNPITAEGRILGTVTYMSPEQAEGRSIDGRSDLFSLGVVLYEISSGQRPFTGDTNLSVLSSILKDTPRPITDINPALPPDLSRIIRRALAKDPERRYQTAKDVRNDLEDLKSSVTAGELAAGSSAASVAALTFASAPRSPSKTTVQAPSSDSEVAVALVRRHPRMLAAAAVVLLLGVAAALFVLFRPAGPPASNERDAASSSFADLQVTQLTTSGNAERPAISPDGRYVAYVQHERDNYSLWIRQTTTTSNVQIVPPQPGVALFGATFTPDAAAIDFVRQSAGAPAWEVWRVPFLGGSPRLFIAGVASPISWSPDGRRIAFLRTQVTPALRSQLVIANADGGQERVLASDAEAPWISLVAPWRPSFAPAWSPDGRLIAVAAAVQSEGLVELFNSQTGSREQVSVRSGAAGGLSWIDSQSLAINYVPQLGGRNQLFRVRYPTGSLSRLTNDPNDYSGISLSGDRSDLVTTVRDARMDLWIGDGEGTTGTTVAERVPISIERIAWSNDQLLYGASVGGRPTILRFTPGPGMSEEVVNDALSPGVTSDGRTIVFVSSSADRSDALNLWTADSSGRRILQLASGVTASQVVVTPDDRSVLYTSLAGGTISIWAVPIKGGPTAKIADGASVAVSPDGASIAFTTQGPNGGSLVVCSLPECSSPRTIGVAAFDSALSWTPDGRGVAYATGGNIWAQALSAGAPRQLTRFTDGRPIGAFGWSRDGRRLALTKSTVTNDIVLFKGLK